MLKQEFENLNISLNSIKEEDVIQILEKWNQNI